MKKTKLLAVCCFIVAKVYGTESTSLADFQKSFISLVKPAIVSTFSALQNHEDRKDFIENYREYTFCCLNELFTKLSTANTFLNEEHYFHVSLDTFKESCYSLRDNLSIYADMSEIVKLAQEFTNKQDKYKYLCKESALVDYTLESIHAANGLFPKQLYIEALDMKKIQNTSRSWMDVVEDLENEANKELHSESKPNKSKADKHREKRRAKAASQLDFYMALCEHQTKVALNEIHTPQKVYIERDQSLWYSLLSIEFKDQIDVEVVKACKFDCMFTLFRYLAAGEHALSEIALCYGAFVCKEESTRIGRGKGLMVRTPTFNFDLLMQRSVGEIKNCSDDIVNIKFEYKASLEQLTSKLAKPDKHQAYIRQAIDEFLIVVLKIGNFSLFTTYIDHDSITFTMNEPVVGGLKSFVIRSPNLIENDLMRCFIIKKLQSVEREVCAEYERAVKFLKIFPVALVAMEPYSRIKEYLTWYCGNEYGKKLKRSGVILLGLVDKLSAEWTAPAEFELANILPCTE